MKRWVRHVPDEQEQVSEALENLPKGGSARWVGTPAGRGINEAIQHLNRAYSFLSDIEGTSIEYQHDDYELGDWICPECNGDHLDGDIYTEEHEVGSPINTGSRGAVAPKYRTAKLTFHTIECVDCGARLLREELKIQR